MAAKMSTEESQRSFKSSEAGQLGGSKDFEVDHSRQRQLIQRRLVAAPSNEAFGQPFLDAPDFFRIAFESRLVAQARPSPLESVFEQRSWHLVQTGKKQHFVFAMHEHCGCRKWKIQGLDPPGCLRTGCARAAIVFVTDDEQGIGVALAADVFAAFSDPVIAIELEPSEGLPEHVKRPEIRPQAAQQILDGQSLPVALDQSVAFRHIT